MQITKVLIAHKGKIFHSESGYEWEQAAQRGCAVCLSLETFETRLQRPWAAWSHLEVGPAWSRWLDQMSSRGLFRPKSIHGPTLWVYGLNINVKRTAKNWLGQKPDVANSNDYIFPHILSALLIAATLSTMFEPVTTQNACPEENLVLWVASLLRAVLFYSLLHLL